MIMQKNITLSVRVSEDEYSAMKAFADFEGETMTSLILRTIRDKMEDWEDVRDAEEILSRNEDTYTLEDVKKELGLGL